MSYDNMVSAEAWDALVAEFKEIGGYEAGEGEMAHLLVKHIFEVEGDFDEDDS